FVDFLGNLAVAQGDQLFFFLIAATRVAPVATVPHAAATAPARSAETQGTVRANREHHCVAAHWAATDCTYGGLRGLALGVVFQVLLVGHRPTVGEGDAAVSLGSCLQPVAHLLGDLAQVNRVAVAARCANQEAPAHLRVTAASTAGATTAATRTTAAA